MAFMTSSLISVLMLREFWRFNLPSKRQARASVTLFAYLSDLGDLTNVLFADVSLASDCAILVLAGPACMSCRLDEVVASVLAASQSPMLRLTLPSRLVLGGVLSIPSVIFCGALPSMSEPSASSLKGSNVGKKKKKTRVVSVVKFVKCDNPRLGQG